MSPRAWTSCGTSELVSRSYQKGSRPHEPLDQIRSPRVRHLAARRRNLRRRPSPGARRGDDRSSRRLCLARGQRPRPPGGVAGGRHLVGGREHVDRERARTSHALRREQPPNLTVSVVFDSLNDKAKLVDGQGKETWLHPANVRTPITVQIPVGVDKTVSLFALEGGGTSQAALVPTKPVGNSNRAVIKQVTTCPK